MICAGCPLSAQRAAFPDFHPAGRPIVKNSVYRIQQTVHAIEGQVILPFFCAVKKTQGMTEEELRKIRHLSGGNVSVNCRIYG